MALSLVLIISLIICTLRARIQLPSISTWNIADVSSLDHAQNLVNTLSPNGPSKLTDIYVLQEVNIYELVPHDVPRDNKGKPVTEETIIWYQHQWYYRVNYDHYVEEFATALTNKGTVPYNHKCIDKDENGWDTMCIVYKNTYQLESSSVPNIGQLPNRLPCALFHLKDRAGDRRQFKILSVHFAATPWTNIRASKANEDMYLQKKMNDKKTRRRKERESLIQWYNAEAQRYWKSAKKHIVIAGDFNECRGAETQYLHQVIDPSGKIHKWEEEYNTDSVRLISELRDMTLFETPYDEWKVVNKRPQDASARPPIDFIFMSNVPKTVTSVPTIQRPPHTSDHPIVSVSFTIPEQQEQQQPKKKKRKRKKKKTRHSKEIDSNPNPVKQKDGKDKIKKKKQTYSSAPLVNTHKQQLENKGRDSKPIDLQKLKEEKTWKTQNKRKRRKSKNKKKSRDGGKAMQDDYGDIFMEESNDEEMMTSVSDDDLLPFDKIYESLLFIFLLMIVCGIISCILSFGIGAASAYWYVRNNKESDFHIV